jgi:hypothetical protein
MISAAIGMRNLFLRLIFIASILSAKHPSIYFLTISSVIPAKAGMTDEESKILENFYLPTQHIACNDHQGGRPPRIIPSAFSRRSGGVVGMARSM